MDINIKVDFEERFLDALERLVWVSKCTPATSGLKSLDELKTVPMTAPASTFPKGESAQGPAQTKVEKAEKPKTEPAQTPAQAKKEEVKEAVEESSTVPTEATAYTFEQIQVACANLARSGKREELGNLIKDFGIPSLPELKEEDYNNFALKLREIGGTI